MLGILSQRTASAQTSKTTNHVAKRRSNLITHLPLTLASLLLLSGCGGIGSNIGMLGSNMLGSNMLGSNTTMNEGGDFMPATVVDSMPICPDYDQHDKPYVQLINSSRELSNFYQSAAEQYSPSIELPQINFDSASVILAGLGQKSTGGYQINYLNSNRIVGNAKAVDITVTTASPKPMEMVPTVITNPCLLIETSKLADTAKLRLFDQNQEFMARN